MTAPSGLAAPLVVQSAAALVVGGELLSGKIRDENSHALARTLRALGIELVEIAVVPDHLGRIERTLRRLLDEVDVVFTSGGVGPTHDDVTVEAVSRTLEVDVDTSAEFVRVLEGIYGDRMLSTHRLMARVPRGARLLTGGDTSWPLVVAGRVWMLPGVPELFRSKLALVREHLRGPAPFFSEFVLVSAEEAEIKLLLDEVVSAHPEVEIGSYPKWFDPRYKTRLTLDGRDLELVLRATEHLRRLLAASLVPNDF